MCKEVHEKGFCEECGYWYSTKGGFGTQIRIEHPILWGQNGEPCKAKKGSFKWKANIGKEIEYYEPKEKQWKHFAYIIGYEDRYVYLSNYDKIHVNNLVKSKIARMLGMRSPNLFHFKEGSHIEGTRLIATDEWWTREFVLSGKRIRRVVQKFICTGNSDKCKGYHICDVDHVLRKNNRTTSCGCYKRDLASEIYTQIRAKQNWVGENHPFWQGGITKITGYLRHIDAVTQWKCMCYAQANSKCELSGVRVTTHNGQVHHLYPFSSIVKDAHDKYNISIKQQVKDYTQEELRLLEDYVAEWHKDTSNAVVLCEEVHRLFHDVFMGGCMNPTTKEDFEEFKQRYLNGEFDTELKEIA